MSKNDRAWEILFDEENILEKVEQDGFFYISSARINEQREARLMAKFDHAVQLPKIFRKNRLSIQPVSRRSVVPIFLSISNDIFSFYKFRFSELNVYNSIELVSEHRYCLGSYGIEISDIRNILENIETISDSEQIPFPQADRFPRIIDLLGRLYNADKPLSKDEITLIYAFDTRQTQYYVSAAIYLGFIDRGRVKNNVIFSLSSKGKFIMAQHRQGRNLLLVKSILCHRIFNLSLRRYLEKAEIPSVEEVILIMKGEEGKIATGSQTVRQRRAQTVRGWISWILELTKT